MMTGARALALAVPCLRAAGVDDPMGDARRLLSHAMGLAPGRLTLHLSDTLSKAQNTAFSGAITAREARVPVSHLVGGRWFFDRWFKVTADVLDPRPDTEALVLQALSKPFTNVLDLGLGTGCILLTLLAENSLAKGTGTDISPKALAVAHQNSVALDLQNRVQVLRSDWFEKVQGQFDLIVSNPPYIGADEMAGLAPEVRDHEPHLALSPGGDGLDAYRIITSKARAHLTNGGRLIVEIGPTQGKTVRKMFDDSGFCDVRVDQDLDGRDRVVQGVNPA